MEYNSKAFVPEEVEKGLHLDLINHLLDYNSKSDLHYYDIHITTDGYCTVVEWCDRDYEGTFSNKFIFVDDNHEVLKEVLFPDNHYEYLPDEYEEEALSEWLEENPGWEKNDYGRWYYTGDEDDMFRGE